MDDRPWFVTATAFLMFLVSMAILGALWSGSEGGHAFAETATASYDSSWLPWAGAVVIAGCAASVLLGWSIGRLLYLCWMGWGIFEGLVLMSPARFSPWTIGLYVLVLAVLFSPPASEWFASRREAAAY